jgi:hypothetical protein
VSEEKIEEKYHQPQTISVEEVVTIPVAEYRSICAQVANLSALLQESNR